MMRLCGLLIFLSYIVYVDNAVTANFISDPRSMFPKMVRTKNAFHFLQYFMGTFRRMFRNKTEMIEHFNYYDDQVKGTDCHIQEELDFARFKSYFDRYTRTHYNPEIRIIFAIMTKDSSHMTVEFHVTSQSWFGFEDHFHMIIRAVNDENVGWGVRYLSMAFNC